MQKSEKKLYQIDRFFKNPYAIKAFKNMVLELFESHLKGTKNMKAELAVTYHEYKETFALNTDADGVRYGMPADIAKIWGILDLEPDKIFEQFCIENEIKFINEYHRFILYDYSK